MTQHRIYDTLPHSNAHTPILPHIPFLRSLSHDNTLRCIPYTLFPFLKSVISISGISASALLSIEYPRTPFTSIAYLRAYHIHSLIAHIGDTNACVHLSVPFFVYTIYASLRFVSIVLLLAFVFLLYIPRFILFSIGDP